MRDYIIMTDSCCDLNAQEVQELELTVLPLMFRMDGVDYQDTPDHAAMSPQEFFHRVANGAECSTSAVSVGTYMDAMRSVLNTGRDILCICEVCRRRSGPYGDRDDRWRNSSDGQQM